MLAQLSQDPQLRDRLLASLDKLPDAWGLIGPNERGRLRDYILNRNWSAIDRFPALTVGQLRASVSVANAAAERSSLGGSRLMPPFVEVGEFQTARGGEADWWTNGKSSAADAGALTEDIGYGLTMGDGPNPELWPWHAQSKRSAYLLNRLALNATLPAATTLVVSIGAQTARTPEEVLPELTAEGCQVRVEDARYFANFGHLHFKGQDVLMPFWLNTSLRSPGARRSLLVPVSHAEEELRIRCPQGNADVSFYFGIDGRAEFRTMDTLDQPWVGRRVAHTFEGRAGIEAVGLLAATLRLYAGLHQRFPDLPFRGYYRLGVCQDAVAAIERRLTGSVTLFPITHDPQYFTGKSEVERLFAALPDDRRTGRAQWARVRGSLPVRDFSEVRIPGLGPALEAFEVQRNQARRNWAIWIPAAAVLVVAVLVMVWTRRRASKLTG